MTLVIAGRSDLCGSEGVKYGWSYSRHLKNA
ncbi:hypothetical protein J2128_001520 [Methanomicrobium sp. W14]|nr:hypothetical protein [Methanomicrobium sp. W14]